MMESSAWFYALLQRNFLQRECAQLNNWRRDFRHLLFSLDGSKHNIRIKVAGRIIIDEQARWLYLHLEKRHMRMKTFGPRNGQREAKYARRYIVSLNTATSFFCFVQPYIYYQIKIYLTNESWYAPSQIVNNATVLHNSSRSGSRVHHFIHFVSFCIILTRLFFRRAEVCDVFIPDFARLWSIDIFERVSIRDWALLLLSAKATSNYEWFNYVAAITPLVLIE